MPRTTAVLLFLAAAEAGGAAARADAPAPEPGIYLEQPAAAGGAPSLQRLEASAMSRTGTKDLGKTMATSMLTGGMFGGGPKMALVFAGARATLRVPPQCAFQFFFDPATVRSRPPGQAPSAPGGPANGANAADAMAAALAAMGEGGSGMPPGTQHPKDFVLVRLEVGKKDERQVVASMDMGTQQMKVKGGIPFRIRTVPDGYRVFTDQPLPAGEYGFVVVPRPDGTGGGNQLWDFGVDGK